MYRATITVKKKDEEKPHIRWEITGAEKLNVDVEAERVFKLFTESTTYEDMIVDLSDTVKL